jgi:KaiC/GvpD/RAD55 family RecA-like ATPase
MIRPTLPQTPEVTSSNCAQQSKPFYPYLWTEDFITAQVLAPCFHIAVPGDQGKEGDHIIAMQSELAIRQLARHIQAAGGRVKVFHCDTRLEVSIAGMGISATPMIWMGALPYTEWLESIKETPLSEEDAEAIARDVLKSQIAKSRRKMELERLRKRCKMSSFDWGEFISHLEAEIHAAVDKNGFSDLDKRLREDLQALAEVTDPICFMRRRAEISSRYRLKAADIGRALRYLDEQAKTAKSNYMRLDEIFNEPETRIDYLIPGMLPVGEAVLLVASPKAGKTLLAYDAAYAVATGEADFLGEQVQQGKVLIVQCDEPLSTAKGRLFKRGFRSEDGENVHYMHSFTLDDLDILEERLDIFRPKLLVVDCLRKIAGKEISENSAEFADYIYQLKELCHRYNVSLILIHHSNKNQDAVGVERVRGSSAIAGAVWGVWQMDHILKRDPNNKKRLIVDPKDPARMLTITARDVEGQRLRIELDPEKNHWVSQGEDGASPSEIQEKRTHEQQILDLLTSVAPAGMEAIEINAHLNLGRSIYCALNRLTGKRLINTRQSSRDFRRTVYFYEQPETDNKLDHSSSLEEGSIQGGKEETEHSPSIPVVEDVINQPESVTTQEIEHRSQIRSQVSLQVTNESNEPSVINLPASDDELLAETYNSSDPTDCSTWQPGTKFQSVSQHKSYRKYLGKVLTVKANDQQRRVIEAEETKDGFSYWCVQLADDSL